MTHSWIFDLTKNENTTSKIKMTSKKKTTTKIKTTSKMKTTSKIKTTSKMKRTWNEDNLKMKVNSKHPIHLDRMPVWRKLAQCRTTHSTGHLRNFYFKKIPPNFFYLIWFPLYTHWIPIGSTLDHIGFTLDTLHTHTYTYIYTLDTHWIHIGYTFSTHWIHTG